MSYLKLLLWCVVIITIYGKTYAVKDIEKNTNEKEKIIKQSNTNSEEVKENLLNTRTGRILVHPRTPAFTLRRRQPIKIRSRSDHLPIRPQLRRAHNSLPNGQQPQPIRYGYESLKSSKYSASSKGGSAQFFNNGKGGVSAYRQQLNHPNSIHVPALSQQFIHNFKASPAFNGQVLVHPVNQPPQQQQQQQDNTYPKYIKPPQQQQPVAAAEIPQQSPQYQLEQQQQQPPLLQYPDFKQYPIPDQEQMQQYNEQHEKYLQQQKYLTPRDPYYQQQQQQHQLQQQLPQQFNYGVQQPQYIPQKPILQQQQQQKPQPSIPIHEVASVAAANIADNNIQFPSTVEPQKMYSVYEENDMTELQNNDYQSALYQGLDKEAQEYIKFMNTNEYFLPKRDPNYKLIDEENDRRQYAQLKAQQQQQQQQQQQLKLQKSPLQQYAQSFYQHQPQPRTPYQQPQPPYQQPDQQLQQYLNTKYTDSSGVSSYSQAIQVPKLFYNYNEEKPNSSEPAASSTVVKTSYQTGYNQNQFIVNSQNNKVSKYKNHKPTQSTVLVSTQAPVETNNVYSQVRHNSQNNRTPEPIRFEFTERDALVGGFSYTHAPQAQLRYKAVENTATTSKLPLVESSTSSSTGSTLPTTLRAKTYHHHNHVIRPLVEEVGDDPEDGDDMQEAGTNLYGRPTANNSNNLNNNQQQSSTTEKPPSEQNDTEEYCERICAIVEDENEEIVCGSDGYMYTSEAQMECYASCLHIDVTIQGKGSCSAR